MNVKKNLSLDEMLILIFYNAGTIIPIFLTLLFIFRNQSYNYIYSAFPENFHNNFIFFIFILFETYVGSLIFISCVLLSSMQLTLLGNAKKWIYLIG